MTVSALPDVPPMPMSLITAAGMFCRVIDIRARQMRRVGDLDESVESRMVRAAVAQVLDELSARIMAEACQIQARQQTRPA